MYGTRDAGLAEVAKAERRLAQHAVLKRETPSSELDLFAALNLYDSELKHLSRRERKQLQRRMMDEAFARRYLNTYYLQGSR